MEFWLACATSESCCEVGIHINARFGVGRDVSPFSKELEAFDDGREFSSFCSVARHRNKQDGSRT